MPRAPLSGSHKAEALVVLTGGSARVERGLAALAAGEAPLLLISGVGEQATVTEILNAHATPAIHDAIDARGGEIILDHFARSTISNAQESAKFIHQRGIRSIRLVTANYHMKRSLHEFRAACPDIEIIADPVFPEGFNQQRWWQDHNTRRLLFSEFYKYGAALIRDMIRPVPPENR